jgi:hypothetical protein
LSRSGTDARPHCTHGAPGSNSLINRTQSNLRAYPKAYGLQTHKA